MNRTYIYMHHDGFIFFMTDHELSPAECYCSYCDVSDKLLTFCDNEQSLAIQLRKLFEEGYDLAPCEEYLDIKDKYCPPKLRHWELDQFNEGSPAYLAYERRLNQAADLYWRKDGME